MTVFIPAYTTWHPTDVPKAFDFNNQIRGTLWLKMHAPCVRIQPSTTVSVNDSTPTLINWWDTKLFDSDAMFNPANPSRLTSQTMGRYRLQAQAGFDAHALGNKGMRLIMIRKNSGGSPTGGSAVVTSVRKSTQYNSLEPSINAVGEVLLGQGDYVECFVEHSYGSATQVLGAAYNSAFRTTWFSAVWVSTG